MTMKRFTFKTNEGRICCSTDNPELLCQSCRRQAVLTTTKSGGSRAPKPYSIALVQRREKAQGSSKPSSAGVPADETNSSGVPKPYSIALAKRAAQGCSR